jgi:transposase InsO family protein
VSHKRFYRVMRDAGLPLVRHTGKSTRTHHGQVVAPKSDLRWCSDAFEIRCWSGERVQVAFAVDCCDREVMAYVATTGAMTGEMNRERMATSIDQRFGAGTVRAPDPVKWLSDNGPPYTVAETREFGRASGLLVCMTPAYSPELNGMAEAFVESFNRD